jgi:Pectate lyase superfamily protein
MSSNVTKRTLSAGLGVGALALLAPRASADTPFSSFAFRTTGAPTARTLPDRLGELKNVKDFGARGDGSTNDTAAIQAAVNQQGTIYFPAGAYRLTRSISIRPDGQYHLVGGRAFITGAFDGFFFDCPVWAADTQFHFSASNFVMRNDSQSRNGGCIRINGGLIGVIEKCDFVAWRPVTLLSGCGFAVRDCFFRGVGSDLTTAGLRKRQASASALPPPPP